VRRTRSASRQPTLSRSIQARERALGLPLFVRRRQGIVPTDFGLIFLRPATLVTARLDDLEHEVELAVGDAGAVQDDTSVGIAERLGPIGATAGPPGGGRSCAVRKRRRCRAGGPPCRPPGRPVRRV
jgi:hypothetical protein